MKELSLLLVVLGILVLFIPRLTTETVPAPTQPPASRAELSCGVLILLTDPNNAVCNHPRQASYDGSDDILAASPRTFALAAHPENSASPCRSAFVRAPFAADSLRHSGLVVLARVSMPTTTAQARPEIVGFEANPRGQFF